MQSLTLRFFFRCHRRSVVPSCCSRFLAAALVLALTFAPTRNGWAGDILRGGAPGGSSPGAALPGVGNGGNPGVVGASGRDSLARTAQALQAVRAMQDAARAAAIAGPNNLGLNPNQPGVQLPNVPNGLTTGGLQVAPGVPVNLAQPAPTENPALWQGANLPTQAVANGRSNVNIVQTQQQALLNWQTFNVGKETSVHFDQTAGGQNASQWIAFNKINDPTGIPSQILGSIDALGQVYLINQNGIIFGGSSQINLHTLVASSLPINDNLIARGLLNNPDFQFLFSSLPIAALSNGTLPAFTPPPPPNTPNGRSGAVTVQPGAQLASPTNADHVGGRIALIGPEVTNGGTVSTPDGQTILAAGQQVAFLAHDSTDPSLRGLDVFVGQVDADFGIATNTGLGLINTPRASTTIVGRVVNQFGAIDSSTSVSLNGRIDLLANYNAAPFFNAATVAGLNPTASGNVTLGDASVTRVIPELASTERVIGMRLALPSQINLQGLTLHLASGAQLYAPSAQISLNAGQWLASTLGYTFVFSAGQVYLDPGAVIDASGSAGVEVSVAQNFIDVQLRGAELANDPLQRNGPLRGQTITIDIRDRGTYNGQTWVGTPLADVSGYVALVQRTVGELTTAGGNVTINAGNSFVLQPGAVIDVSGGWINYQGASVATTKLISGSNIFDIAQATPDRVYTGIYNGSTTVHPKWGIIETNSSGLINGAQYEPGYTQGANGGSLSINAPSMALDGTFTGTTVSGERQHITPPAPSSLSLAFRAQTAGMPPFTVTYPTPPDITFRSGVSLTPADPFALDPQGNPLPLRPDRLAQVILSPELFSTGSFGNLMIDNSDGNITVPADVSLTTSPGGSITLTGANVTIGGRIAAPGGALSFTSLDVSPADLIQINQTFVTPPPDPTRGNFVLGSGAVLSTAGLITDQRQSADALQLRPFMQNGGSISIAGYSVDLNRGSVVDVSGGVIVSATGSATYGTGGVITVSGGQDPSLPSLLGGTLVLGADLRGYSGGPGGTLNLLAPLIRIGASPDITPAAITLSLAPDFFSRGGFNTFALTGIGTATSTPGEYVSGLIIGPNTQIAPVVESLLVNLDRTDAVTLDRTILPPGGRGPVNLSFRASGASSLSPVLGSPLVRGDLLMSATSSISTEPGGTVALRGQTVAVLGTVNAPGGRITVAGGGNSSALFPVSDRPLPTVDLGPNSALRVIGATVFTPNVLGLRLGRVLAGGSITISGNIVAEAGSILDVSGTAGLLDLAPGYSGGTVSNPADLPFLPTRVESNAGSITLNGSQELFLDSTLIGLPGGPSANGGSVFITSDRFTAPGSAEPLTPLTTTLVVTQSGPTIPEPFYAPGETAIGHFVTGTDPLGRAHVAADSFAGHGIDSLTLRGSSGLGATQFDGPVSLVLGRQLIIIGGAIFAETDVSLSAPYLRFGTDFAPPIPRDQIANAFSVAGQPFYFPAQFGAGTLTASGSLIDLGNLSLQGVGAATFIAENGDIRGDGTLNAAGAITLTAGQIYPVTGVRFTIAADDYLASGFTLPGIVTINHSGTRQSPLSAGGELNIFASILRQDGTLRAPSGTINLGVLASPGLNAISNAPFALARHLTLGTGSVTSVSAAGLTIPYGTNLNGTAWIDPAGVDITVGGVPGKTINLAAANVADVAASTIDLRGGGDLLAYRFVPGNGGTNDILGSNNSFAIVPGYQADFAPIDPGYSNPTLAVGDRIYLNASSALPAGFYTLLPARYALLPGAVLVTPQSGLPATPSSLQANGASFVAGYRFNDLNPARTGAPINALFEVAPPAVVQARAQYDLFFANTFLRDAALAHSTVAPRLPIDAGQLVLNASQTMTIEGIVKAQAPMGGRGGLIDISSPADILIGAPGESVAAGTLFLDASALSAFGAESLLIGGVRSQTADGTVVNVVTDNVTVDNAGFSLTSPELILVANRNLRLAPGAELSQSGMLAGPAETLLLGSDASAGSGDGLLLRLTSDPAAAILRRGVDSSGIPHLTIGAGVRLTGASLTLDSTSDTRLDPTARLEATAIALNSGQITLALNNSVPQNLRPGLVLSNSTLQNLPAALQSLSFLSYSTIDLYGTGQVGAMNLGSLALHAGEIRGFENQGGTVLFAAQNILLDNSANGGGAAAFGGGLGTLQFDARTIQLGQNQVNIDQFSNVVLNASNAVIAQNAANPATSSTGGVTQRPGSLTTAGNLTLRTPLLTGAAGADESLRAAGSLMVENAGVRSNSISGGLGARLTLEGARVTQNSAIVLPSGSLTMHATLGDVTLGGSVDVSESARNFYDLVEYTSGGEVNLIADQGNVMLLAGSDLNLSAQLGGGNAGRLSITLPAGAFSAAGTLSAVGGAGGRNGSFALDVGQLGSLGALNQILDAAAFTQARDFRVRTGDVVVDGLATARNFGLSTDAGSILVTGTIDSSGNEGGAIALRASGSVTLAPTAQLTVAAQNFDAAGKGGSIWLEAGSQINGVIDRSALLDLQTGSSIDLSVAANNSGSLARGQLTGTLHLRAPQTQDNTDVQIAPINSAITGASSISVEGYALFDLTGTDGTLTTAVQDAVRANGEIFLGPNGASTPTYTAMRARLLANNSSLQLLTVFVAGAEIINRAGDLTLGSAFSDPSADWDLSTYRFGPNGAPGVLTLRASGNIALYNALSDGFTSSAYDAELLAHNAALPANVQSWTYRLAAGADLSGADFHDVRPLAALGVDSGSLLLGKNYGVNVFGTPGPGATTANAVRTRYQVIRTGTGEIEIAAGRDVQLLNQFAVIFTAGTRVDDPTLGGTFDLPIPDPSGQDQSRLGAPQQGSPGYAPQYSYAGGNISITAGNDIAHLTRAADGTLVADSTRELPNNWLDRRGFVDPATGLFGAVSRGNRNDIGSTTWWIDFSNFFEGIGTLGGGNIALNAGRNVSNVDAVAPTNARMPQGVPNAANLLQLGGGNLSVLAGNDIDAGVYYVERGRGTLAAGGSIHTNSTRSPSGGMITSVYYAPETWLPTTLFLGQGMFDVSARRDLELGPTANPFLLPQGINNTFWYKTYFSTYAPESAVHVTSLTGDLTLRESAALPGANASRPLLQAWLEQVLVFNPASVSYFQPWLRLAESQVGIFSTLASVSAPTLQAIAFLGDLNIAGKFNLFPSPIGTVDLMAGGAINGIRRNGLATINQVSFATFGASQINLSDADPARIPSIISPFAFRSTISNPSSASGNQVVNNRLLDPINLTFDETGSTAGSAGVLQTKQALHAAGLLHLNDPNPVHIYASTGDVSGLTLFSGKPLRLISGRDVTDIALFIQNNHADDITLIAAGRDLIAYDPNSPLRANAQMPGNLLNLNAPPATGDIQINGPGTLEVLAGRDFDLGVAPSNPDRTGLGVTSSGNARNPFLPFAGADIVAGAGIGASAGLDRSDVHFADFAARFLDPASGGASAARYLPALGELLGLTSENNTAIWQAFQQLPAERQDDLALQIFYLVLRDAGRDRNDPASAGFGNYQTAYAAINALFPGDARHGNISLTSREIKTANGGNISLFAPGGQLVVGFNASGDQALDQGILTEHGGNISIYTEQSVIVGTSRIFTLRGGNELIFSKLGDIAAGASSKTVQAAPPTRVLVDPQSGDVQTDLAGLATGGGIGVLNTVVGVPPGDVDLIAPAGTVDAGDAGIRVSGNLNIAAVQVLNSGNIAAGGASVGTPVISAPNLGALTAAGNTAGAQTANAAETGPRTASNETPVPSIITVEVLGYGGGGGDSDDEEEKKKKKKQEEASQASIMPAAPVVASSSQ